MANEGTSITNDNAGPYQSNYEICQRSGFKLPINTILRDGYKYWTRAKSADTRHPGELIRSTTDKQLGSVAPEGDDVFLADNEVQPSDL